MSALPTKPSASVQAVSKQSYLNISRIISAAEITNVDAIHPGYGFLAENAHFAEICDECNIKFIGPPPRGHSPDGRQGRAHARPRRTPACRSFPAAKARSRPSRKRSDVAREIGFPVIIKASAGGGGRGMRICWEESELQTQFDTARNEAERAFSDGVVYLEKYIERPRHIEIQVLADEHGNIMHLGERECSIQRRHQKLIEEAPSPALIAGDAPRRWARRRIRLCEAIGYASAGTVEFLFEDGKFYFMEMNTRIQVEHPVTEEVTGIDLVKEQIRVAAGEQLSVPHGRVPAARPRHRVPHQRRGPGDLRADPGKIRELHLPGGPGVRVDTHVYRATSSRRTTTR